MRDGYAAAHDCLEGLRLVSGVDLEATYFGLPRGFPQRLFYFLTPQAKTIR